jgi:hypothetical protein
LTGFEFELVFEEWMMGLEQIGVGVLGIESCSDLCPVWCL